MIQEYTNTTTGTNYGSEQVVHSEPIPIHGSYHQGPFVRFPTLNLPPRYIITKTHCGGHKLSADPLDYIETTRSFEVACRSGSKMALDQTNTKIPLVYSDQIPQRAIHLVRNPFDNIVARLHMEQRHWAHSGPNDTRHQVYLDVFNNSQVGFQAWCHYRNRLAERPKLRNTRFMDDELWQLAKQVPCVAEFIRYVSWHNLAIAVTQRLRLPIHVMFYEDYTEKFNEAIDGLLDFLELKPAPNGTLPEFITGKHYVVEYFEPYQLASTKTLVHTLASPETWQLVSKYFD
jgi:hypothetical protein